MLPNLKTEMTPYEAIEAYLGRPQDSVFNIEDYTGPYGGLINIVGLRHKGLVVSGTTLYNVIQEAYDVTLDRWTFMHELSNWCAAYTNTSRQSLAIGANFIIQGAIQVGNSRYFCVPPGR